MYYNDEQFINIVVVLAVQSIFVIMSIPFSPEYLVDISKIDDGRRETGFSLRCIGSLRLQTDDYYPTRKLHIVTDGKFLYTITGRFTSPCFMTVLRLDPAKCCWAPLFQSTVGPEHPLADTYIPWLHHSFVHHNGRLYVFPNMYRNGENDQFYRNCNLSVSPNGQRFGCLKALYTHTYIVCTQFIYLY